MVIGFISFQGAVATDYGIHNGSTTLHARILGARTIVNLSKIPPTEKETLISEYVYPSLAALKPFLVEAKRDHLSVFNSGSYENYLRLGPP